jgi:predicted GTPase
MTVTSTNEPTAQAIIENLRGNAISTANGFDNLAEALDSEKGLETTAAMLRERAEKLREDRFTFLVLGEFKRGKSTLLNAMLGRDLLPRKAAPCTAVLTSIRYGMTPAVSVLFTDGRVEHLSPEQFHERYELKVQDVVGNHDAEAAYYEAMDQDRFKDIDMAEVAYPLDLCRHGVELVDSPGLAEHRARERRTLQYLREADAVIVVLDAINFLNQRELAFIHNQLTPLGLRSNLFFVINRWNTLTQGLLDPNDPAEVARTFEEQNQLIELRLKPLCNVRGVDLSAQRIFKIDALNALKERIKGAPDTTVLEETQVPAFERSLALFLVDDRLQARQEVDRNHLMDAKTRVAEHRHIIEQNLDKPLEELKAQYSALEPKLEELSRVRKHIENFLSATASSLAQEMIDSFHMYMEENVRKPLPEAVQNFDLGRAGGTFATFDKLLDFARPEGKKFKDLVNAKLEPQIAGYLRPRINAWVQTLESTYLRKAAKHIESELLAEAKAYASILEQVGQSIGSHLMEGSIEDILKKWLNDLNGPNMQIADVGMDLAPVMAGIVADLMSELLLHMSFHLLPGIGIIFSAIRLYVKREGQQADFRKGILASVNNMLNQFESTEQDAIRSALRACFAKLEQAIAGKIQGQIDQIDGDMRSLIESKESQEADSSTRRQQLTELQARVNKEISTVTALLRA